MLLQLLIPPVDWTIQVAVVAEFVMFDTQPERLEGMKPAFEHACKLTTVVTLLQLLDPPAD